MDEYSKLRLGEFYKELRLARKIKLKDIAKENLSISQLSKFETGHSMLSADKLLLAINGIHMTLNEFSYARYDYKPDEFLRESKHIKTLFEKEDLLALKEKRHRKTDTVYDRLICLVVAVKIKHLEPSYQVATEEVNFLYDYLFQIDIWTQFELYLFANCLSQFNMEQLRFLSEDLHEKSYRYLGLPAPRRAIRLTYLCLIEEFIFRQEIQSSKEAILQLKTILLEENLYEKVILDYLEKYLLLTLGQYEIDDLMTFINSLDGFNIPHLLNRMRKKLTNKALRIL